MASQRPSGRCPPSLVALALAVGLLPLITDATALHTTGTSPLRTDSRTLPRTASAATLASRSAFTASTTLPPRPLAAHSPLSGLADSLPRGWIFVSSVVAPLLIVTAAVFFVQRLRPDTKQASPWLMCSSGTQAAAETTIDPTVVVVGNIPASVTWQMLKDHFKAAGPVVYSNVFARGGRGIVRFATARDAERALQMMPDLPLKGVALTVGPDEGRRALDSTRAAMGRAPPRASSPPDCYVRDEDDAAADKSQADMEFSVKVEELVNKRVELRNAGNYAEADAIREKLRRRGVTIDDRSRTWFVNRVRRGASQASGYVRYANDPTMNGTEEDRRRAEEVLRLLDQRQQHRRRREFAEADRLLERLRADGIWVSDDTRTWSAAAARAASPGQ